MRNTHIKNRNGQRIGNDKKRVSEFQNGRKDNYLRNEDKLQGA